MFLSNRHIPILTYHNICEDNYPLKNCHDWISVSDFESQLAFIQAHHFSPISFQDLINKDNPLPKKSIILSFDDGYESFYSLVFPLLKKYNFKASYFIFTDWIAETPEKRLNNYWNIGYRPKTTHLVWTEIKEMFNSGIVEIGSHTKSHKSLTNISLDEVNTELKESKEIIEYHLKHKIDFFSYPGGHGYDNNEIRNSIKKNGYLAAVSAYPPYIENYNKMDRWALKRIEINQSITMDLNEKTATKNKLITKIYHLLFFVSQFNALNGLANRLIRFYIKH